MNPRWRLFTKYAAFIIALVSAALLASGGISLYFSWLENQDHLVTLQREKALAAATRIEQYINDIEHQLGWTALPQVTAGGNVIEQRRYEYLKLLRQAPAITEVAWLDKSGREQLRVSRLAMDVVGSGADLSQDPKFMEARGGKTWYSPVYFRKETEPYMTISRPAGGAAGGTTVAEVNLKFVWEVVSRIQIGKAGLAYVVNSAGTLIAHPDISLVLQKTDLSKLSQVAALALQTDEDKAIARNIKGEEVLSAHARIPTLNWTVFVELPLAEAFAPLYASIQRTGLLLLAGLILSVLASVYLARLMVNPIRALQRGAAQIGAGRLDERIEVHTGDELETLADQFNKMAGDLKESYSGLERKVDERTAELTESLEQQTATAEILRVISSSPTDIQPVFDAILENATRLCDAHLGLLGLYDGKMYQTVAQRGGGTEFARWIMERGPFEPSMNAGGAGRIVLERKPIHIPDYRETPGYRQGLSRTVKVVELGGVRTYLGVPMFKEGRVVGGISIYRPEVRPFTQKQIDLVTTFASQAVIAIENVRLFKELEARTLDLTQSVGELTALGEVGRAVSSTLDLETVLVTIVTHAVQLSRVDAGTIYEYDEAAEVFVPQANYGLGEDMVTALRESRIRLGDTVVGACAARRAAVQIPDVEKESDYPLSHLLRRAGFRALLGVPLLRDERIIGALVIRRRAPGEFPQSVVTLLQTFAAQSVLAIQNARLFREIQDKSRQLETANKHKSEFLANMSHELRTPLNAIIGFSDVLVERLLGEINAKQEEYLRGIQASGEHLLSLINDILDLSKVEAGRMELEVSEFDLPAALQNALTLVRERAHTHGIRLALKVDPRLGGIRADERKVKQIMLNLLSNAVKFTLEGGRVEVDAHLNTEAVEIAVSDTGIGIAQEDQEAVFEEFRQVGRGYTAKHEGTGLGLALTRRFVELHGGRIRLESEPGKGSTFTFTLPLNEQS